MSDLKVLADRDWDGDLIKAAIDLGGGQSCDVLGVLRELSDAGFVIVPREPTEEMVNADMRLGGYGYGDDVYSADPKDVWQAMINAALAPKQVSLTEEQRRAAATI